MENSETLHHIIQSSLGEHKSSEWLLIQYEGLIHQIASQCDLSRSAAEFDDLLVEGKLAVLEAAKRFDPQRGTKFSTYLYHWINKYVKECADRTAYRRHCKRGRPSRISVYSLDSSRVLEDEEYVSRLDTLEDNVDVYEEVVEMLEHERIQRVLGVLEEMDAMIVDLSFGLTDKVQRTPHEVGEIIGMSRHNVTKRLGSALEELRPLLAEDSDAD